MSIAAVRHIDAALAALPPVTRFPEASQARRDALAQRALLNRARQLILAGDPQLAAEARRGKTPIPWCAL